MFADKLRKSLLQAAIQGQLTEQLPTDGDAHDLLKKIRDEKAKLIKAKKIKVEKPLPPVTDEEIPFELPANWCWCRLGEICSTMQYGTAKKSQPYGKIPVLRMGNLQDGKIDYNDLVYSSDKEDIKSYNLDFNDLLFNRTNSAELVGKVAIYKGERKAIFAGYLVRLKAILISSDFLNAVMQSSYYKNFCYSVMGRGVSQANISANKLKNFLLPLPPLAEQLRIVERLDALLSEVTELAKDERELNLHVKNFPQKMKNSLLQAAIQGQLTEQLPTDGDARDLLKKIRDEKAKLIAAKKIKAEKPLPPVTDDEIPFELPANWCWCRLGEVSTSNIGLTYNPQDVAADGVIVLRSGNIIDGKINYNDLVKVNVKISESKLAHVGDILICARNGSKKLVGKAALIDRDGVSFGAFMAVVRSQFNPYILRVINSPYFRRTFLNDVGTTTINQITQSMLKNFLVPLPPLAEQLRIVERLNELLPLCEI